MHISPCQNLLASEVELQWEDLTSVAPRTKLSIQFLLALPFLFMVSRRLLLIEYSKRQRDPREFARWRGSLWGKGVHIVRQ